MTNHVPQKNGRKIGKGWIILVKEKIHSVSRAGEKTIVFTDGGVVDGIVGRTIGPEALMALGSALGAEGEVALGHWGGVGAGMLARAAASGVTAAGGRALCHDLDCAAQAAWLAQSYQLNTSLFIEQQGERVFLHLFGRDGLPLERAREERLEYLIGRREYPRVGAEKVGRAQHLQTTLEDYCRDAVRRARLSRHTLRTLTVAVPGNTPEERALKQSLSLLGCAVTDTWRAGIPELGARRGGFALTARDERGSFLEPEQLLPLLCLLEMEHGSGKIAVPEGASAAVELVAAGFGSSCLRLGRDGQRARERYAAQPWLWDAVFAAVRILSRMSMTGEHLESLMAKTPRFSLRKREVPLTSSQGAVLRELAREQGQAASEGGLRLRTGNGWVYVAPLLRRQALRIMAESPDMELAAELCDFYVSRAQQADRRAREDAEK